MSFLSTINTFRDNLNDKIKQGVQTYNTTVDGLHKPQVDVKVEPSKNFIYVIVGVLIIVAIFVFKKK